MAVAISNMGATWNTSPTAVNTAIKMNVVDTSSNLYSKLIDLQVNSSGVFSVEKYGGVRLADYGAIGPTTNTTGIVIHGSNNLIGNPSGSGIILRGNDSSGGVANSGIEVYAGGTERLRINNVGQINISSNAVYLSTVYANSWYRSTGITGWWNDDYSGGIYMGDTTWVKTAGNKGLWAGAFAGTVDAGTDTSQLQVQNGGGTGDSNVAAISFHCAGQWGVKMHLRPDGYFGIGGWSAASWRWYIYSATGDMVAAGNVTAYSDERLKENIKPLTDSLDKVKQLNGVKFNWKNLPDVVGSPGKADYGILAHEVEAIAPELISGSVHKSPDGDPYKTVAYDKLVPLLIEAVKELSAKVDRLEEELKNK